ncbi:hypothetical protein Mal52_17010 [Symmachiella dynata]|uniref:Uncharacterized protein n=1 Tax=Symmachiella dynata TaxID=2527995 RepID=A0A517ZL58_9PLAN|nr:hypothetical protein Mal52_17010 [Symmachiella dynata]
MEQCGPPILEAECLHSVIGQFPKDRDPQHDKANLLSNLRIGKDHF